MKASRLRTREKQEEEGQKVETLTSRREIRCYSIVASVSFRFLVRAVLWISFFDLNKDHPLKEHEITSGRIGC